MDLRAAARDPWVWGQVALFLLVGLAAPLLPRHVNLGDADYALNRVDPPWIRWLATVPIALGLWTMIQASRALGPALTPGTEPLPDAALVTTGPYARVRHPIYGGAVLLLAGYSLAWSNWTQALLVAALARAYFEAKARAEERRLEARFPAYRDYMRRVPRRLF